MFICRSKICKYQQPTVQSSQFKVVQTLFVHNLSIIQELHKFVKVYICACFDETDRNVAVVVVSDRHVVVKRMKT